MSNSINMTIQAKLVEKIKQEPLAALLEDHDSLEELALQAIRQTLNPTKTINQYGQSITAIDDKSPVIIAAKEAATKICQSIIDDIVNDKEIQAKIKEAIFQFLPQIIIERMDYAYKDFLRNMVMTQSQDTVNMLKSLGKIPQ